MKKVHIIGLGLLGGSFALALKKAKPEIHLTGMDTNPDNLQEALERGIIDEIREEADPDTDVIVISTPINTIVPMINIGACSTICFRMKYSKRSWANSTVWSCNYSQ